MGCSRTRADDVSPADPPSDSGGQYSSPHHLYQGTSGLPSVGLSRSSTRKGDRSRIARRRRHQHPRRRRESNFQAVPPADPSARSMWLAAWCWVLTPLLSPRDTTRSVEPTGTQPTQPPSENTRPSQLWIWPRRGVTGPSAARVDIAWMSALGIPDAFAQPGPARLDVNLLIRGQLS